MKKLLFTIVLAPVFCLGQSTGSTTFNSGTLEGWENTDGSTENLSLVEYDFNGNLFNHLRKECDGAETVLGEMSIVNRTYFNNLFEGETGFLSVGLKNENEFDLYLRMGFQDADGTKIISSTPVIIEPGGGYEYHEFSGFSQLFTVLEGPNTAAYVLSYSTEMRLIHNQQLSFEGAIVHGIFDLYDVSTATLGLNDNTKPFVRLYPNPAKDSIMLLLDTISTANVTIYDILGKKVMSSTVTTSSSQLNVEFLDAGIYMVNILASDGNQQTLKFIKE